MKVSRIKYVVLFLLQNQVLHTFSQCFGTCRMELVESIPDGLKFDSDINHLSTYEAWIQLIDLANRTIEIGSYYWTLQDAEYPHSSSSEGKEIFRRLKEAGTTVSIKIASDLDSATFPNIDLTALENLGAAEVRRLNFTRLLGAGVLHTKMWVVDRKHVYIGSANFDWRALTQVKELGILITDCPCFGEDLGKAFDVYWELGKADSSIPETWSPSYEPFNNKEFPMGIEFNNTEYEAYISSSPPQFCPNNRTTDLDSIFEVIDNADEFIHIAVMDYFPLMLFSQDVTYWSEIDDRLRKAAIDRKIKIKLLMAKWDNTRENAFKFLSSLQDLNGTYPNVDIQIKLFEVPSTEEQSLIPFARVNHNKYMVSDKSAYIGTSNWSGDYFVTTAGIGVVITPKINSSSSQPNIHSQVADIFSRDWNSSYSKPLDEYTDKCKSKASTSTFFSFHLTIIFSIMGKLL